MTDTPASSAVPAAWYPDPYGAPLNRWWDGTSWTDHTQARVAEAELLPAVVEPVEPSYLQEFNPERPAGWYPHPTLMGQQRWWNGDDWTEHVSAPVYEAQTAGAWPSATDASPSTWQIWANVALYAVIFIVSAVYLYVMLSTPSFLFGSETELLASYLGLAVVGLLAWLGSGWLAYSDVKELAARGISRPFHWAYTFIPSYGPTIYIIGRSVVARRRTGRGIAPMWWHIATYIVGTLLQILAVVLAFAPMFGAH